MYVCVCLAVTESEVRTAIECGATTRDEVTRACRAGGDCGACHGMISTMIEDHLEERDESGPIVCRATPSAPAEQLIAESALVRTRAA